MRPLVRALASLTFAGMVVSACDCHHNGGGVGGSQAELGVVWSDSGGEHVDRDATYDFGQAFVGDRIVKQMKVRNLGAGQLRLTTLTQTDGAATTIGSDVKDNAYFEVKFMPVYAIDATAE